MSWFSALAAASAAEVVGAAVVAAPGVTGGVEVMGTGFS
jgi:hypothetical protein